MTRLTRWVLGLALLAAGCAAPAANLAFSGTQNVNGGNVVPGTSSGTMTLASSGLRSALDGTGVGGTGVGGIVPGTVRVGQFRLKGPAGHTFTLTGAAVTLNGNHGGTMTVEPASLTFNPAIPTNFPAGSGNLTIGPFAFGLTVIVGTKAATPPGTYTGFLTLTATDTSHPPAVPDGPASHPFQVTVTVVASPTPIQITQNTGLDFGAIVPAADGSVTITPVGGRTASNPGPTLAPLSSGSAANFTVKGLAKATYTVTLPSLPVTLQSGPNSMTLTNFTSSPSPTGTLGSGGTQTLTVGATLGVGGSQAAGTYSGTYTVTVTYD